MNDDLKSIWDDLSYMAKRRSEKVLKYKKDMKTINQNSMISICISGVLTLFYIIPNGLRYIYGVIPSVSYVGVQPRPLNLVDVSILIIAVGFTGYWYSGWLQYKKTKKKYDLMRKSIAEMIGRDFCQHFQYCNCKDTYIKGMEKEKVDLTLIKDDD